jgi:hypothetical protein
MKKQYGRIIQRSPEGCQGKHFNHRYVRDMRMSCSAIAGLIDSSNPRDTIKGRIIGRVIAAMKSWPQ